MEKIDFSLAGKYLHESDDLDALEKHLVTENSFSITSMNCAMGALYSRVGDALEIEQEVYEKLSNKNKFYLIRGAFPEHEREIRAYILERFYKFTS